MEDFNKSGSSKSILKSTSIIGGSQILTILLGLIRSKAVALLLGPAGTGLIGVLQGSTDIIQSMSGLGLGNSAVRDIAKANSANDVIALSKTIQTLRYAVLITGIIGFVLTFSLAGSLSKFSFGSDEYVWPIRVLSIMVFFNLIKSGQSALIQGMRQIRNLALLSIIGGLLSTSLCIPILYFYETNGIALYLVTLSISQFLVALFFSRKINTTAVKLSTAEFWNNAQVMLKLGVAFMAGGLITLISIYLIKVFIIRQMGLQSAGIYQAAMAVSGLFINFVLQAMGKDFYPRLAAVAFHPEKENRIINEQTEIGMLLAAPGLLFTLAFAPLAIRLFYTQEYIEAYPVLQWMILGLFVRTISWPMDYLFVARAKASYYFWIQFFFNVLHLIFIYFFIQLYGLKGAGIAFFLMYVVYIIILKFLTFKENKFNWNKIVIRNLVLVSTIFLLSFIILYLTSEFVGAAIVSVLALFISYLTLQKIMEIMEINSYGHLINYIKSKFRKKSNG